MNTTQLGSVPSWMAITVTTLTAALTWGASSDPPQYEVLILEVPDYATGVTPWGINDKAQIVGHFHIGGGDADKPFLWDRGQFIPLELPTGYVQARCEDINNNSQIVGTMGWYVAPGRGVLWDGGQIIDLGTLEGGNFSTGEAINDKCQITGYWGDKIDGDPPIQAYLWEDGVMTNLGPDFPETSSQGMGMNEHSQITGEMWTPFVTDYLAYVWDVGEVVDFGPIPGGFTSEGRAINNQGDVTGRGRVYTKSNRGWIYHGCLVSEGVMIDIGTLPGPEEYRARDINDATQIVGYCDDDPHNPGTWGFLWQEGVMYFLDELVPPEAELHVQSAYAINNVGQISAGGKMAGGSATVILTPINPRPADVNWDGKVNIDDLFEILGGWGPCADPPQTCPTDVNDDGTVNIEDIFEVIGDWG